MMRHEAQHFQPGCRPRGFTLTELMVIVFIIGVIGMVVVPQATGLRAPALRTAADILAADIEFCQSENINNPADFRAVQFNIPGNTYSVVRTADLTTPISHPADSRPFTNDFNTGRNSTLSGVTITSITGFTNTLTFDAFGKPGLTVDAVITLAMGTSHITVTIDNATGDVTVGTPGP